jgi:hypothetical protein
MTAVLARPPEANDAMLYVFPQSTFAEGTALVCKDTEVAIFLAMGRCLGVLGAGAHPLVRASIPFLSNVVETTAEGNRIGARIALVDRMRPLAVTADGDLGTHGDPELSEFFTARFTATVQIRVAEADKLGATMIAPMTADSDVTLASWVRGLIVPAVRDAFAALVRRCAGPPPRALVRLVDAEMSTAIARPLHARLDQDLATCGLKVFDVADMRVDIEEASLIKMLALITGMKIVRCKTCQAIAAHFCTSCGKELTAKEGGFCASCGAAMSEKAKFCASCGAAPVSQRVPRVP